MELEEVSGVEVVYEETENGRVARFQVSPSQSCYLTALLKYTQGRGRGRAISIGKRRPGVH